MIEVTLEQGYAEACKLIGELSVERRILAAEVQRLTALLPPPEASEVPDESRGT